MEVIQNEGFSFNGKSIISKKKLYPLRWIVYGDNGVGKSTLLSQSKNPILIDIEGNCKHLDVARYPDEGFVQSFDEVVEFLKYLLKANHNYGTFGLDSLDSMEILISEKINYLIETKRLDKGKDIDYGNAKKVWASLIKIITDLIEEIQLKRKMNFIATAHLAIKKADNPLTETYDRYDMRINNYMKTGFCTWVSCIFFAHKEIIIEDEKGSFNKRRAKNIERRVLYTHGGPTYYGKNTFNLPERILFEGKNGYEEVTKHIMSYYGLNNNKEEQK
jgi:hypothetical protein